MNIYLVILFSFITLFLIFKLIMDNLFKSKKQISMRLNMIYKEKSKEEENYLNQPFFIRLVRPLLDNVSKTILKITPKEFISTFENKVVMAGNPFNLSTKDWINIHLITLITLPLITLIIYFNFNLPLKKVILSIICELAAGLIVPNFLLSRKKTIRQKQIQNTLPDVIDLLTVSVEAGLGFDGALAKVIEKMPGPLAEEFDNVLQEIKVGRHKRDALKDMADRIGIQDLTTFIGSIIQADQLGVSIGKVLRIQSEQMRTARKQRAQEKAMKAPIKMLIPMVLFIFPTIFTVLLGPAVIKLMDVFMK